MSRRSPQNRQAARVVVLATIVVLGALAGSGTAAGQESGSEDPPAESPSSSAPSTTTTAPPVTVVLDDGDVAVVPPGATDPNAPPPGEPPPGDAPPAEGELAVPEELPVVLLPDPTPGLNAALAAIDVGRARAALVAAEPLRLAAEQRAVDAAEKLTQATDLRRSAAARLTAAKQRVDALAVNLVMYGDVVAIDPLTSLDSLDALRDRELGRATAEQLRADLEGARATHQVALASEDAATLLLMRERDAERAERRRYLDVRRRLDEAIAHAEAARRQQGPTILGPTVLDAGDLVAWYRTFYPADPPVAPIEAIIDSYLRVGEEEGVTGDIAFAQAILETGGFRSGHARGFNFAGIGAFDHCAPTCGFRFANLDDGVRAHIHLLRAYADPGLTSAQLAATPNRQVAPERVGVRGCCPRWTALTGVWASDPQYDRKVLGIYRLMVETGKARQRFFATAP